jgi:hypothetical protein
MAKKASRIEIGSVVAASDGELFVVIEWGERRAQLTPDEAVQHAWRVLEVAAGAITDEFLFD